MAKGSKQRTAEIQRLLDEKHQLERWLERLSIAADKTEDHVRSKVGEDYSERLEAVIEELHGYRDDLDKTLERHKQARDKLVTKEAEASERLAEAELRHAVGEYDEAKWTETKTEILESLVKIREELQVAQAEIASLEEVMKLVHAPSAEAEEPAAEAAVAGESVSGVDEASAEHGADEEAETAAAAATEQGEDRASTQTDAFDEMAFIKSVTEDDEHGPSPSRASGVMQELSDDERPAEEQAQPSQTVGAEGEEEVEQERDRPAEGAAQKTLKCGECGALNLPTEWYCERCGAELAAL